MSKEQTKHCSRVLLAVDVDSRMESRRLVATVQLPWLL